MSRTKSQGAHSTMNNPNDYLVGLDIGSHKVLCVVALPSPKGEGLYRICGYSFRDSHGVRNGIVTDLNAAVDDIKAAVREARSAGNLPELSNAWVAIGGSSLTSENCLGTAVVRGNEVKPADVEAAENNAREHSLRQGKQLIKMIPQGYSCGDTFSQTPVGLVGDKVTAYYHAVYGSVKNAENMKRSLLRSGIELAGYEPHPIAAALAVSTESDRYNGTLVLDMGAETTSMTLVYEHRTLLTAVRPFGSEFFTRDLSTIFGVSLDQAEELKIRFGSCSMDGVLPGESVRPSLEDVRGTPLCSRSLIVQTLYERAKEFFRIYRDVIEKAGHLDKVHAVIITGGGANLRAIDEVARDVFGVPVRIGAPLCLDEKNALSMRPNASVAAGLLMAADKTRAAGDSRSYRTPSLLNLSGRIRTVFFGDY